jgi:hypothetical protein
MHTPLPTAHVPHRPHAWDAIADYTAWPWQNLAPLAPFTLADGSGPAYQATEVRLCHDADALYLRFDCVDQEIWGIATQRDAPIYDEEVVELFIAPGATTPVDYFEFEVSPLGTLLDLTVHSPDGARHTMQTNFAWDCPALQWQAQRDEAHDHWCAYLIVPWRSLLPDAAALPKSWRANFYRIDRPHNGPAEFSCWSPTYSDPADYHLPAFFGKLHLDDLDADPAG